MLCKLTFFTRALIPTVRRSFCHVLLVVLTSPCHTPTHFQVVSASTFTKHLEAQGKKIGSSTITVSTTSVTCGAL